MEKEKTLHNTRFRAVPSTEGCAGCVACGSGIFNAWLCANLCEPGDEEAIIWEELEE